MSTAPVAADTKRVFLVVEDEPVLRASMVRGLSKLEAVEIAEAGSVREAERVLASRDPALVLSDLNLPDGSGVELAALMERRGLRVPLVFVSAFVGKYRGRLPRRGDVEVYEKPVSLERLRSIVQERLSGERATSPFGVADYVQLAGMGRHSVIIDVRADRERGVIVIRGGQVVAAKDDDGEGLDAFRRLVFARDSVITCRAPKPGEEFARNIEGSCEGALLEAARLHDESARGGGEVDDAWGDVLSSRGEPLASPREEAPPVRALAVGASVEAPIAARVAVEVPASRISATWAIASSSQPPTDRPPSVSWIVPASQPSQGEGRRAVAWAPPEPIASSPPNSATWSGVARTSATGKEEVVERADERRFRELLEEGLDALLAKNYRRALVVFTEAAELRPDDSRVRANLRRLAQLGYAS